MSRFFDKNGIAVDKSLRDIEVVLPISLKGMLNVVNISVFGHMKNTI